MRICRLIWEFPKAHELTYGLGPNFFFISKEQVKLGSDVHIIARGKPDVNPYEEVEGIKIHRVKSPYNINAMRKIRTLDRKVGIDIIHAHGTCGILYPLVRRNIGIPLVAHAHSMTLGMTRHAFRLPIRSSLKLFLKSRFREESSIVRERFFWRSADLLIAVSEAQKKELVALYGIERRKVHVVYNGVQTSIFKPQKDTGHLERELGLEGKRVILSVGHFALRKGIPYLLEAMPEVLRAVPDAYLLCVGGTPRWLGTRLYWNYLREIIDKRGLGDYVKLMGQIPHLELPYYYSLSDVFAFPSLYEAFAKVVLEAMACETPVIASRVGGLPEAIEHNVNGILVSPKNVNQLAQAVVKILRDEKLAQRMGSNGRGVVKRRFTWRHTARELLVAYQEVL